MNKIQKIYKQNSPLCIFAFALAFLIQIQASLFAEGDYLGLRLNLADILLPLAGLYIMISLFTNKSNWPKFQIPFLPVSLIALTVWFMFSLIRGHSIEPTFWSLINKGVGWFVLLAYFSLGAWLSTNNKSDTKQIFVEFFVLIFSAISFSFVALMGLEDLGLKPIETWPNGYLKLFLGNRNIAGFIWICNFLLLYNLPIKSLLMKRISYTKLLWVHIFILPYALLLNGSRIMLVYAFLSMSYVIFKTLTKNKNERKQVTIALLGGLAIAFALIAAPQKSVNIENSYSYYRYGGDRIDLETIKERAPEENFARELKTSSDPMRQYIFQKSIDQWKVSPFIGTGIGVYATRQAKIDGFFVNIIDSTPLWFLVETGIVGLVLLFSFFLAVFISIWILLLKQSDDKKSLYEAMLIILILFAGMSLVHELTYTRFIWLLVGMFTAVPKAKS